MSILPQNLGEHRPWRRLASSLLVAGVVLPGLLLRLGQYPSPWFDEGYKMNAAYTLAEDGVYATHTVSGDVPFDPGISAGAVVILPVALSFRVLGPDLLPARLPIVLFAVVVVVALCELARRIYGRTAGLFIALFVLLAGPLPDVGIVALGRQVLGEVPALAFALLALRLCIAAWDRERVDLSALAGVAAALAILAKPQFGFGLLPALAVAGVGRWRLSGGRPLPSLLPPIACILVVAGWNTLEGLVTPPALRAENAAMMREVLRSSVFVGGWGTQLGRTALCLVAAMTVAVLVRGYAAAEAIRRGDRRAWPEVMLVVFVAAHGSWFALLSIGWPRYAFAGVAFSLVLWGKIAWDLLETASRNLESSTRARAYRVTLTMLAAMVLLLNSAPPLLFATEHGATEMGAYIRQWVPPDAVIESWDWEIDALSRHRRFHHPHQRYLFAAVRRYFSESPPPGSDDRFRLAYDAYEADPDYLISGRFSEWARIYDHALEKDFRLVATFGGYRLFERVRR